MSTTILQTLRLATKAVTSRLKRNNRTLSRETTRAIFNKQSQDAEEAMTKALIPFFEEQIKTAQKAIAGGNTVDPIKPEEWHDNLIDAVFPVMLSAMAESVVMTYLDIGIDLRKSKSAWEKANKTTATEWLESEGLSLPAGESFGGVNLEFITELPPWAIDSIKESLEDQFAQGYWQDINGTTADHVNRQVQMGLSEGWSTQKIAKAIGITKGSEGYYHNRAVNIARTEMTGAMSAARDLSIDKLKEMLPEEASKYIGKEWLSVLGNTTRDTHAALDGTSPDKDGMFNVGGYMAPYPSHHSLPAGERCNCQCSLITAFGAGAPEDEIREIIEEMDFEGKCYG